MINQPQTYNVSGTNSPQLNTQSQDAMHMALLAKALREMPNANHGATGSGFNNKALADALMKKAMQEQAPTQPNNTNPATGQDWSQTGSGYAGNGGYMPDQYTGIDSWLNGTSGIDNSALGSYDLSGLDSASLDSLGGSLDSLGTSLDGLWQGIGSIGDWFGSLFGSGGALEGVGTVAEEAAPVAAAAA